MTNKDQRAIQVDAVVVGAGFSGLYMLHKLRELGLSVQVIECGSDVGGTWYWNRYPGARCDAESTLYCYSFDEALEQEWEWSERFATQPEILRYVQHVADRFDLRRDIWFDTRVDSAIFNDDAGTWQVRTDRGDSVTARYCIMATGNLSAARMPEIPGLADTGMPVYHTGNWPHEGVDLTGKNVAVIGTGSSAIQAIPIIAGQAAHLTVYQRTPSFSVPARNAPLNPTDYTEIKRNYQKIREQWRRGKIVGGGEEITVGATFGRDVSVFEEAPEQREAEFERRWQHGGAFFVGAYRDLGTDEKANAVAADFIRNKIKEIVQDPATAEKLTPYDFPVGAKRIVVDTDYYATFNRANVALVDVRPGGIEKVADDGVVVGGEFRRHDVLIVATGFDAMTGALAKIDIRGSDGLALKEKWAAGPRTALGLMTAGFPNLFLITGPGSPSVLGNVLCHIEQHVDLVSDLLALMEKNGDQRIEALPSAEDAWVERVNAQAASTLYPKANSWYLGANVPGKPRVFMPFVGGIGLYREICEDEAARGYPSFLRWSKNRVEFRRRLPAHAPRTTSEAFAYLAKMKEGATVDDLKILALVEAIGKGLYDEMASRTDNAEVRNLLVRNGDEEMVHARRLSEVIEMLTGKAFEIPSLCDNPLFTPVDPLPVTKDLLLELAEAEFAGEDLYGGISKSFDKPEVLTLFRQSGNEELEHAHRLQQAAALL